MGAAARKQTATEALIAKHPLCVFCNGLRRSETREHMPPKALFDGKHRPDKLVMPSCLRCNSETSKADLIASLVSRFGEPSDEDTRKLVSRARKQIPDVVDEWTGASVFERMRGRRHLERYSVSAPEMPVVTVGPSSIRLLNIFAYKVIIGLRYEHTQFLMPPKGAVYATWRSKEDFWYGVPPELLALLPAYGTLRQGTWDTAETFEYRFNRGTDPVDMMCFLARFRSGLFVFGFTIDDGDVYPEREGLLPVCDILELFRAKGLNSRL